MTPEAKPRRFFPLYAKILLWFFVHVALVALAAFWLLRSQFDLDRNWLLDRAARDRLQALGERLTARLRSSPSTDWDGLLREHGEEHRATLALHEGGGEWVAGPRLDLPQELVDRLRPPGTRSRRRPRPGDDLPRAERTGEFPSLHRGAIRAGSPRAYWIHATLPPVPRANGPPREVALVGKIDRLGQSDLLFNPVPWLWAAVGALSASALLWFPFVRGLTRSLGEMTHAAREIARGRFGARVNARRNDELGQLSEAVNQMSERLEGFVTGQKRFLGDIAHELCSPLARMEVALGVVEQRAPEALRSRLADVQEEVREMSALVGELLSFSKAGLQGAAARLEAISLPPLIANAAAREGASERVRIDAPEDPRVMADPALLGRALANLLRNCLRHGGDGPIDVSARRDGANATILVRDHGPGVPEDQLAKLFDPFFRLDASRARETGGVGLGLAIVKSCVEACGGAVTARNATPSGLAVEIVLRAA